MRSKTTRTALAAAAIVTALFSSRQAAALKVERIDFGTSGTYDNQVYMTRNDGALVFRDTSQTTPVTLLELASGAGAASHSALSGLGADDHAQYLSAARHAATHSASFNSALPVSPDVASNATLGGHLGDAAIHLDRAGAETIAGQWTFANGAIFARLRLPNGATPPPSGAVEGDAFWDSDNALLLVFDGAAWSQVGGAEGAGASRYPALDWASSDSDRGTSAAIHYQLQVALSLADLDAGAFTLDVSTTDSVAQFRYWEERRSYAFPAEGLTSIDYGKRVFYELAAPLPSSNRYYARVTAWDGATSSAAALLVR